MSKKPLRSILLGAASIMLAWVLWWGGLLDGFEAPTWTWRARAFARPGQATDQVRLILLDQASLDWGAREMALEWPWPREIYTAILDFCRRGGARAVAFDVLMTEPSQAGVADDEAFGQSVAATSGFVGAVFLGAEASFPVVQVATNAALLGNVREAPDDDGVFRRARGLNSFEGRQVPSMGLAAYLAGSRAVAMEQGRFLTAGEHALPLDAQGRTILRYRGSQPYQAFSAAAVIQSELRLREGEPPSIDPEVVRNRYVIFAFSAPGLLDLRSTPLAKAVPGAVVHATLLDNLLSGDALQDTPVWLALVVGFLVASAGAYGALASGRAWKSTVLILALVPLPLGIGFACYAAGGWFPVAPTTIAVAVALVGGVLINFATVGRQKAFIKRAFGHYLSRPVMELLLEDPARLQLGGERRTVTIFFSDLQSFSAVSERLDPVELTGLMNDYLTDMTEIILDEQGTLDKYEGDAILAFWNAPVDQLDHAERACRAAVRCHRKLAERGDYFRSRYGADLRMRIGINTGVAVVGNMGSHERFDYTVLGDSANLASRLEGANKAFGTGIMVSEQTWSSCSERFRGRELGLLRVVGKGEPARVFELQGFGDENLPEDAPAYAEGLTLCREGKWAEATHVFEQCPDDPVCVRYAQRCRKVLLDPAAGWDGVWSLTEK